MVMKYAEVEKMSNKNEPDIFEQMSIFQIMNLLDDPENTFSSEDISKIIDKLSGVKRKKESIVFAEMGEKENEREEFIRAIRKFMEMRTLTKQVLNELIDHIDVYETQGTGKNKTQRLVIYYKFVGYLDIDPTQCHPNYTADIREGVAVEYVSCEPSEGMKELFPEQYGVADDSFEEE